jgi:integrase
MEKRIEFISFEEFQKLYKATKDKELKLAMLLGFGSGLRISEIIGLRPTVSRCCGSNVEFQRVKVSGRTLKRYFCLKCNKKLEQKDLKRNYSGWKIPPLTKDQINLKNHQIRLDVAKGGKWRVTVTPKILNEEMLKLLPLKVPRRTLQYKFDRLCLKELGKKMSFHVLRHGFGNYSANNLKLPLPMIQQFMGHTRLDTTGIYTKANPEQAVSEAWRLMGG